MTSASGSHTYAGTPALKQTYIYTPCTWVPKYINQYSYLYYESTSVNFYGTCHGDTDGWDCIRHHSQEVILQVGHIRVQMLALLPTTGDHVKLPGLLPLLLPGRMESMKTMTQQNDPPTRQTDSEDRLTGNFAHEGCSKGLTDYKTIAVLKLFLNVTTSDEVTVCVSSLQSSCF